MTRYYFGGASETTGTLTTERLAWKKYYSFAGQTIAMRDFNPARQVQVFPHRPSRLGLGGVIQNGGILEQQRQRYLPFGEPRAMPPYASVTSTDFTYTGNAPSTNGTDGLQGSVLFAHAGEIYSAGYNYSWQAANPQS